MNFDSALQTFFAEAEELLVSMESALLRMDEGEKTHDIINEVFRAAHTIKGSAGLFGLDDIVAFTHKVENVLDLARDGKIEMSGDLLSILLPCRDHIAHLVDNAMHDSAADADCIAKGEALIQSLSPWLGEPEKPKAAAINVAVSTRNTAASERDFWHISVRLGPDLLRNGMDPLSIIRFLGTMGTIAHITTLTDHLPELAEFDPEQLYLGFEISFQSSATQAEIENTFMLSLIHI